jgi:uncharacterized alpha-E superfamily protein
MLSRTAANLFWMARYVERADCTARLIEMGRRMTMLPGSARHDEWRSVLKSAGVDVDNDTRLTETNAIELLMLDEEQPSSIRSCLTAARANARAVRTALTQEMWEALNDGWRRLETLDSTSVQRDLPTLVDWVTKRCATFRGAAETGMLRLPPYHFMILGGLVERADMTLRLLDVKYYVLLPETDVAGGGRDYHQWTSVLHATGARRAYHHVFRGDYAPWLIAELLLLRREFPRSLAHCYDGISDALEELTEQYGQRHECHALVRQMTERFGEAKMNDIFQGGLHEFVLDANQTTRRLSELIARAYHF